MNKDRHSNITGKDRGYKKKKRNTNSVEEEIISKIEAASQDC